MIKSRKEQRQNMFFVLRELISVLEQRSEVTKKHWQNCINTRIDDNFFQCLAPGNFNYRWKWL